MNGGFQIHCKVPNYKPKDEIRVKQESIGIVQKSFLQCSTLKWEDGKTRKRTCTNMCAQFVTWNNDNPKTILCTWSHCQFHRLRLWWPLQCSSCAPWHTWIYFLRIILSSSPIPLCQCSSRLESEIRILVEEYFGHHLEEVRNYAPKGVCTVSWLDWLGHVIPKA